MQVYKLFFKIILKNLGQMMIYVSVFIVFAVLLVNVITGPANTSYTDTKVKIAFINHDKGSKLANGLRIYLGKKASLVDIKDDTRKLQDALFFRKVEYILIVPAGFTEKLLMGKDVQLEKVTVPDSTSRLYMDNLINKYLNTVKIYSSSMKNLSQKQLDEYVSRDLSLKTEVVAFSSSHQNKNSEKAGFYFNYLAYSLFAVLILGVCSVMMVFNESNLKMRNQCSPLSLKSFNVQMVFGNISFAVLAWFLMILTSFFMYGSYMFTPNGLLLLLSSFIFTLAALSISFLIGNVLKSKPAMSAAANVFSLGTSFIGGAFVPQALLGKTALMIGSFTPTYWYVKANNDIINMTTYKLEALTKIFTSMLITLGFAAAVFAVTLVLIKQKRVRV